MNYTTGKLKRQGKRCPLITNNNLYHEKHQLLSIDIIKKPSCFDRETNKSEF